MLFCALCMWMFLYDHSDDIATEIIMSRNLMDATQKENNDAAGADVHVVTPTERIPLVIVPGSMGSILEAKLDKPDTVSALCSQKKDWYTLWITQSALIASNCFFDNVYLKYAGNGKMTEPEGVETRVPFYGKSTRGIKCLLPNSEVQCSSSKNWYDILEKLEEAGYEVGKDLFSAPFDFRRGPNDFVDDSFPRLKSLIEAVYQSNNNRKVAVTSVSLGSLFLHAFFTQYVDQAWKDKYIERWLSMSGTFNGFGQSFVNTVFGRNQFLGFPVFQQNDVRDAYRSWYSANWLIPKPIYGDTRVILDTPSRKYTLADMDDVLFGDQLEMYRHSFQFNVTVDPGVPVDCWYSVGKDTAVGYKIKQNMNKETFYSDAAVEVEEIIAEGDGAADIKSLEVCKQWPSTRTRQFKGLCHGCFLRRAPSINALLELFTGMKAIEKEKTKEIKE